MKRALLNSKLKHIISRRDFLRLLKVAGLEFILLMVGGIYMQNYEPSWVEFNKVTLKLPRLAKSYSGLRVVQISDLHFGGWMTIEILRDIVQMVVDCSPDLVVITGDFVMGDRQALHIIEQLDDMAGELKVLSERFPTLGVLGNHGYLFGRSAVIDMFQLAGITDLNNAVHTFVRNGDLLHVAGVDDVKERRARMDQVLAQLPDEGCAILLAHEPDYADVSAATGRFDLQLSGHSHGGQVVLPFIGPPVLPRLAQKYPSGLYKVGEMYQYTNRGLGMTRPYIRLNCRPEITIFTLESI